MNVFIFIFFSHFIYSLPEPDCNLIKKHPSLNLVSSIRFCVWAARSDVNVAFLQWFASRLESDYRLVKKQLNLKIVEERKLNAYLKGSGQNKGVYPHSKANGDMVYYRYNDEAYPYAHGLTHELIHSLRERTRKVKKNAQRGHYVILEEGIAELVAKTILPKNPSIPFFGKTVEEVMANLYASGHLIALSEFIDQSEKILKCPIQSYTVAGSFFIFLRKTYGMGKVLQLINSEGATYLEDYQKVFGLPFGQLESNWLDSIRQLLSQQKIDKKFFKKPPYWGFTLCTSKNASGL